MITLHVVVQKLKRVVLNLKYKTAGDSKVIKPATSEELNVLLNSKNQELLTTQLAECVKAVWSLSNRVKDLTKQVNEIHKFIKEKT